MKYRTYLKREGRYYRLQTLHRKRVHYSRVLIKADGQIESTRMTPKMEARYWHARRLYYEAYYALNAKQHTLNLSVRSSLTKRFYNAYERADAPGRMCDLSQVEEAKK